MLTLNWNYCILRFWTKMESSHRNIINHLFPLLFPSWSLGKFFSNSICFGWFNVNPNPLTDLRFGWPSWIWIIFVYIHEKPLRPFPAIPIFSTPEEIQCGLMNLLIIDPAKNANNCSIIDKFENKFKILNDISGKGFFFCCFKQVSWHEGFFFAWKIIIVYY